MVGGAGVDPVSAALAGGDDYELLFAIPQTRRGRLRNVTRRVADPPLTRIGVLTKDTGALIVDARRTRRGITGADTNTLTNDNR